MTAKKSISIIVFVLLIVSSIALLVYNTYDKYIKKPSFVLVYPNKTKIGKIGKDITQLKKAGYEFRSVRNLKSIATKGDIPTGIAVIILHRAPSKKLISLFQKENVPAMFFINSKQVITTKKYKNISFGLRPFFEAPTPKKLEKGYVSINFDDGWRSIYENGLPILKEAKVPATVFAIPQAIINDPKNKYVSSGQLRRLQDEGWEIGSHGLNHENFRKLNPEETISSLSSSKNYLESLGLRINGFALPYGDYKSETLILSKEYYDYNRFADNNFNIPGKKAVDGFTYESRFSIDWFKKKIENAKKDKTGLTLIFHEVSDNGRAYAIKPSMFKKVLSLIKDNELPIYTNIGLLGKPLFLRQENESGIESEADYSDRLSKTLAKQKKDFERSGIEISAILYPEGITTNGLIKAAKKAKFKIGFSGDTGFLKEDIQPFNIKTVFLTNRSVKEIIDD